MRRGLLRTVLAVFMLSMLCAASTLALNGSLSVRLVCNGIGVEGARIVLYRIADAVEDGGAFTFTFTADFQNGGVGADALFEKSTPKKLAAHAKRQSIVPLRQGVTDIVGDVTFDSLAEGAYLVVQNGFETTAAFSEVEPFLITIPAEIDGKTEYAIRTKPKVEPAPIITPTPKPTEKPEGKIPQTGFRRTAVIALAIGGIVLFSFGWALVFLKRDERA